MSHSFLYFSFCFSFFLCLYVLICFLISFFPYLSLFIHHFLSLLYLSSFAFFYFVSAAIFSSNSYFVSFFLLSLFLFLCFFNLFPVFISLSSLCLLICLCSSFCVLVLSFVISYSFVRSLFPCFPSSFRFTLFHTCVKASVVETLANAAMNCLGPGMYEELTHCFSFAFVVELSQRPQPLVICAVAPMPPTKRPWMVAVRTHQIKSFESSECLSLCTFVLRVDYYVLLLEGFSVVFCL